MTEDYYGLAADGNRNMDNWNVAHVAPFHDDHKMLSLATEEQCREPNKWGNTPTHMCAMPHNGKDGCSLSVLYTLIQMGVADPEAVNHFGEKPWDLAQKMQKPANLKKFENILYKGKKPDGYDSKVEAQLRLRGKFAKA